MASVARGDRRRVRPPAASVVAAAAAALSCPFTILSCIPPPRPPRPSPAACIASGLHFAFRGSAVFDWPPSICNFYLRGILRVHDLPAIFRRVCAARSQPRANERENASLRYARDSSFLKFFFPVFYFFLFFFFPFFFLFPFFSSFLFFPFLFLASFSRRIPR